MREQTQVSSGFSSRPLTGASPVARRRSSPPGTVQPICGLADLMKLKCNRTEIATSNGARTFELLRMITYSSGSRGPKGHQLLGEPCTRCWRPSRRWSERGPSTHTSVRSGAIEAMPRSRISRTGLRSNCDGGAGSNISFTLRAMLGPRVFKKQHQARARSHRRHGYRPRAWLSGKLR